jgi:anti-sigma regulatory factor (Ser/Thr protein kinase)
MRRLELEVDPAPDTPGQVRRAVRDWSSGLVRSETISHNISLIVGELVTNAVVHARSTLRIVVTFRPHRLRIEVHDDDSTPPHIRPDPGPDGGFGLHIVTETSNRWGWLPTQSGKLVWADVTC